MRSIYQIFCKIAISYCVFTKFRYNLNIQEIIKIYMENNKDSRTFECMEKLCTEKATRRFIVHNIGHYPLNVTYAAHY